MVFGKLTKVEQLTKLMLCAEWWFVGLGGVSCGRHARLGKSQKLTKLMLCAEWRWAGPGGVSCGRHARLGQVHSNALHTYEVGTHCSGLQQKFVCHTPAVTIGFHCISC